MSAKRPLNTKARAAVLVYQHNNSEHLWRHIFLGVNGIFFCQSPLDEAKKMAAIFDKLNTFSCWGGTHVLFCGTSDEEPHKYRGIKPAIHK